MINSPLHPQALIAERYEILSVLGQGGTGITYAATDRQKNCRVALKALDFHRVKDWKILELFEREARILANLEHPGIPTYYHHFQEQTEQGLNFYLVQQLASGRSLFDLVSQGWRPTVSEVKDIAIQVLEILAYLQQLTPAVIHRDIKPQNLIRQADGKIFLVDFGAVQDTYHNTVTGGSTVIGTFGYMAPEQFRGQAVLSTDLYGLGATLLFLLTAQSPADLPQRHLTIQFRDAVSLPTHLSECLDRMIEPASDARFSSAQEALAVLQGKQPIPSRVVYQRPKQTRIKLTRKDDRLIISIPSPVLNSLKSLVFSLIPILLLLVIWVSLYDWFFEIVKLMFEDIVFESSFPAAQSFFRLFILSLLGIPATALIGFLSSKTLLFSALFHTRLEIMPGWIFNVNKVLLWELDFDASYKINPSQFQPRVAQSHFALCDRPIAFCALKYKSNQVTFGAFLRPDEQAWLIDEICSFAKEVESR
jgi:eukaryotic-like serine/threonine-protein kinase